MKLSEHFELSEFTRSETAANLGIDNTPNLEIIANLTKTASMLLEPARVLLGNKSIRVTSGYRCLALNRAIRSLDTSAHVRGMAADFVCPDFGTPLEICRVLEGKLPYDQLIFEFGSWVHIAWDPRQRGQMLTIDASGTRFGLG